MGEGYLEAFCFAIPTRYLTVNTLRMLRVAIAYCSHIIEVHCVSEETCIIDYRECSLLTLLSRAGARVVY